MKLRFTPLSCLAAIASAFIAPASAEEKFECRWAAKPPVIDGKLDEEVWKHAQVVESFETHWLPEERRKPPTKTKARVLWDREYLYFSAEMEDTDVYADVTQQDGEIWTCDVFELFFKPSKEKTGYYEFEVNAANGKLDMFLPSRGAGGYKRHKTEREFHIESAVDVRGTLNNWADTDKGWTVEGCIPWRDFLPTGGRPAPGEVWQHTLCRYDYSAGLENQALSATAPLTAPNFHRYEDFLPIKFIGPHDGAEVKRVPWDTSRLVGSPEPQLPFRGVPAFPKLKMKELPITIIKEELRDGFLLLESNGYEPVRKSRLARMANDPNAVESEMLLEFDESIFDLCFHPKYADNGYLYIGANGRWGEGKMDFNNRLLRYTMDHKTGKIDPASRLVLMEFHSHGHNGLGLAFGKDDGMLYMTSGDGTSDSDEWDSGQDLTRLLAKMLRIDVDHPSDGKPYGIPADNPFLKLEGARPETWSYGFRNPWRMSKDPLTGDLWVGENGQDLWEYARIVHRGENYGWPIREGSHEFHQNRKAGPTPFSAPLIEHPRMDFRSLTGGIVYRGKKYPELYGCYIYGDYSTGQIWAAKQKDGKLLEDKQIAKTGYTITNFCESPQGDILVVDHKGNAICKLEPAPPAKQGKPFPAKLSETGLFTDATSLKPHPALIPYEVNAPGWHDGAVSERYIALPALGRMVFADNGGWNLPEGSAVVQTLTLDKKRIETRVLLFQENEWSGYTYAWNDAQTDATRVPKEGETRKLASGQSWHIPSRQECMGCHSRAANFLLGVSTQQLNSTLAGGEDQLVNWERAGLLRINRGAVEENEWRHELGKQELDPKALQAAMEMVLPTAMQRQCIKDGQMLARGVESFKKLADPLDKTASLNDRARSYLHVNCAHCHARNAGGNSLMQLASNVLEKDMSLINADPMHTTFGIPDAKLIVPKAPAQSLLVYRPAVRGPGQMPPMGTSVPDGEGVALLSQWIASLPASKEEEKETPRTATSKPSKP